MECGLLCQLLRRLPITFTGLRVDDRLPLSVSADGVDCLGLIFQPEKRHFVLFGRAEASSFVLDSANLQSTNCCSVYVIIFAALIALDVYRAEKTFAQFLERRMAPEDKIENDYIIMDSLTDLLAMHNWI